MLKITIRGKELTQNEIERILPILDRQEKLVWPKILMPGPSAKEEVFVRRSKQFWKGQRRMIQEIEAAL
jgi:hypothetical protein